MDFIQIQKTEIVHVMENIWEDHFIIYSHLTSIKWRLFCQMGIYMVANVTV